MEDDVFWEVFRATGDPLFWLLSRARGDAAEDGAAPDPAPPA